MVRAIGINHVALEVDDVDAALSWYGRFLHFQLRDRRPAMAWIDLGDQFVAISQGRTQPPDEGRHFGLVVDEINDKKIHSLKEMAEEYGVSYPTIRQRLDGLIEKLRRATKEKPVSELRRVVRQMVENGELDLPDARKLLSAGAKDVKDLTQKQARKDDEHD